MSDEAAVLTPPAPAVDPPAAPEGAAAAPAAPESVEALPEWTQKMIRDLRSEAASNRTKATAAEQTRQETMDAIAKALGLKDDDDPAKAAQTAAEQRDAALAEAKATKVENAVLKAAARHNADPEALTDSRSFMSALEALDPASDTFAKDVAAAIKTAVEANPKLALQAPEPPKRSGGPVGGGAPVAGQLSREDLKGMTPEAIEEARLAGRLNKLQGIS